MRLGLVGLILLAGFPAAAWGAGNPSPWDLARARMVDEVVKVGGVKDVRVLNAIRMTPRHEFVDPQHRNQAYFDMSLPIGHQQTISSPLIVGLMTQSLDPQPSDNVLEIGTGSGYQAAVLSPLVKSVYTIEIVEPLGRKAERTLKKLRYNNVFARIGDGYAGWPEHSPFDKIIVTCSPEKPPQPLVDQLKDGGLMVIPIGERYQQLLCVMEKRDGKMEVKSRQPTLFVPMTGQAEEQRKVQPDGTNLRVVNGDFEQRPGEEGFLPGWYYERLAVWEGDPAAPDGEHFVTFRSTKGGESARLLQGMPLDGRKIATVDLSARVRCREVQIPTTDDFPTVAISFYDENRKELGVNWLDRFQGTRDWFQVTRRFRVPREAREAILRVGLFGGRGEISFDDIRLVPAAR